MPSSDWRSPAAYGHAQSIPAAGFAWEYLRRDDEYRRDFHRLKRKIPPRHRSADRVHEQMGVAISRRTRTSPPIAPRSSGHPRFSLTPSNCARQAIRPATSPCPSCCRGFPVWLHERPSTKLGTVSGAERAASIASGSRTLRPKIRRASWSSCRSTRCSSCAPKRRCGSGLALAGRPPGDRRHDLPPQTRDRHILILRALDAKLAGASYRVIAEALLGFQGRSKNDWEVSPLKNKVRRLVADGLFYMRGGYRELLHYPVRAPRRR